MFELMLIAYFSIFLIYYLNIGQWYSKIRKVNRMILEDEQARYAEIINNTINMSALSSQRNKFLVTIAETLIFKGDLQEAGKALEAINVEKLTMKYKALFYCFIIKKYVYSESIGKAEAIYMENKQYLLDGMEIGGIGEYIKSTVAIFSYYYGEAEVSDKILTEILSRKPHIRNFIECRYTKGLIEIDKGNIAEGKDILKSVLDVSEGTMFHSKIIRGLASA